MRSSAAFAAAAAAVVVVEAAENMVVVAAAAPAITEKKARVWKLRMTMMFERMMRKSRMKMTRMGVLKAVALV